MAGEFIVNLPASCLFISSKKFLYPKFSVHSILKNAYKILWDFERQSDLCVGDI